VYVSPPAFLVPYWGDDAALIYVNKRDAESCARAPRAGTAPRSASCGKLGASSL